MYAYVMHAPLSYTLDPGLSPRYVNLRRRSKDADRLICIATDTAENVTVAVRKVKHAFGDATSCVRTLREVRLLQHFAHENVLTLRGIMLPPPGDLDQWTDVYLVLESMDTDLHYIIHCEQPLTDGHIQYFIYQLLRGLKAIHSAEVLLLDLKPTSVLVNKNCDLKICDFGLARGVKDDTASSMQLHEYVGVRAYHAPEVLAANRTYDERVDIWSTGCILAECLGRKALMLPAACCMLPGGSAADRTSRVGARAGAAEALVGAAGGRAAEAEAEAAEEAVEVEVEVAVEGEVEVAEAEGEVEVAEVEVGGLHQLRVLVETLGEPTAADLAFLESLSAVQLIKSLPKKPTVPLNGLYHHANPLAVDLLEKMLAFNPSSRISAAKALEHDYLRTLHHVDDEPIAPHFDFDVVDMDDTVTESELRNLMWDEVRSFHSGGEE